MQQGRVSVERRPAESIGGRFRVDATRPLPALGAGLAAFAAIDMSNSRDRFVALQVRPGNPPRPRPLAVLAGADIPGLMRPLGHGVDVAPGGRPEQFVVCSGVSGTPVSQAGRVGRRWNEVELIRCVLVPITTILAELETLGITHRSIRADNVFQTSPGQPVELGAGWAAPPASSQPAAYEPPYVAACWGPARGDGAMADDIYALGVLILTLAAGVMPMEGVPDDEVVRRKLAGGSHAALTHGLRLPRAITELVEGMLADDPEHRPTVARLRDPEAARGRRLATRPARLASRPMQVGGQVAFHARSLAAALSTVPEIAMRMLRDGRVDAWLRQKLGDATLAARLDTLVRGHAPKGGDADAVLLACAIALLDPLAPLYWGGFALWPDGFGPALAAASGERHTSLLRLIQTDLMVDWATLRDQGRDVDQLRGWLREWRIALARTGWSGGPGMLLAWLNPCERCASLRLGDRPVLDTGSLLDELERQATAGTDQADLPLDAEMAAFIAGRDDLRLGRDVEVDSLNALGSGTTAQLRLLARLELRWRAPPLPGLAARFARLLEPSLATWRGVLRRDRVAAEFREAASRGSLNGLLELLARDGERQADLREFDQARAGLDAIEAEMVRLTTQTTVGVAGVRRTAEEIVAACGLAALCVAVAGLLL